MLNKVTLIGNICADPEVKYTPSGTAILTVSLATSRRYKEKQTGEKKEDTEFHRLVMFGKTAEIAGEYLKKGSQTYVEGRLRTQKWQTQDGQDRYTTEIVVEDFKMLGKKQDNGGQSKARPQAGQASSSESYDEFDDDIPF